MEDQGNEANSPNPKLGSERSDEGVVGARSRWSPKAEQILILESIFNSGMVNPPKHETVRIRKLLEKFGTVADANVFYWFQNRRSRSRRRHRQMLLSQASLHHPQPQPQPQPHGQLGGATLTTTVTSTTTATTPYYASASASMDFGASSSSSSYFASQQPLDPLYPLLSADHMGFLEIDHTSPPTSLLYPPPYHHLDDASNFNYHSGYITVFINGVATEVPWGLIDIKTMFGQDVTLVHSSGVPLPTNESGFLMQDLQHGESYFLVSNPT